MQARVKGAKEEGRQHTLTLLEQNALDLIKETAYSPWTVGYVWQGVVNRASSKIKVLCPGESCLDFLNHGLSFCNI